MNNFKKIYKILMRLNKAIIEDVLFAVFLLIIASLTVTKTHTSDAFSLYSLLRFLIISSPVISLYLIVRLAGVPPKPSLFILSVSAILLYKSNATKKAMTGEVLSFNDMMSLDNIGVAVKYASFSLIAGVFISLLFLIALFFIRKNKTSKVHYLVLLSFLLIIFPVSILPYSYILTKNERVTVLSGFINERFNLEYLPWDWNENAKKNGLPFHLMQTSLRVSPPKATLSESVIFKQGYPTNPIKPKTVIFILCESCWYDNENFKKYFSPLIKSGYEPFRAKSPAYGGGTANVEFEMLTGLPSNSGVLSGIIYQEYSGKMKEKVLSIPRSMKDNGYVTVAVHNNSGRFWHRDVVYKKFGFDKFITISDMYKYHMEKSYEWPPRDDILYLAALNEIKENKGTPIFLNLATMHTHGAYEHDNDSGEGDYTRRLKDSISQLVKFTDDVHQLDPNAIIVVYGDHKPALNKYYYEHSVFDKTKFLKSGESDSDFVIDFDRVGDVIFDVPAFISTNNTAAKKHFINEANGKPYFCVSSIFNHYFINTSLFSVNYNYEHGCGKPVNGAIMTPPWIYSLALFD